MAEIDEKVFSVVWNKREKELLSFILGCAASEHPDMDLCLCYSAAPRINGRTYRRGKMTFWWRNLCWNFIIICLIVKIYLSHTYENPKNGRKQLSWNFVCKNVYFTRFNNCWTVCFCSSIGSLYVPFMTIYWLLREKRTIFAHFYKCFKAISSFGFVFIYKCMQHKLMCHSSLLTIPIWLPRLIRSLKACNGQSWILGA